jgi:hypothetical protein
MMAGEPGGCMSLEGARNLSLIFHFFKVPSYVIATKYVILMEREDSFLQMLKANIPDYTPSSQITAIFVLCATGP